MRFDFSLFASRTLAVVPFAIAPFAVGCIDVTCAERGTCAPGETTEAPLSDASPTIESPSNESANSGVVTIDGSVSNGGSANTTTASSSGCITSCAPRDASAATSMSPNSDGGSSAVSAVWSTASGTIALTDASSDVPSLTEADACVEICDCDGGDCAPSSSSEVVEAGPRGCSVDEVAACVSPASICVMENDAPVCIECRNSEDCAVPTGVCVATRCEVCEFVSNTGCLSEAPFCIAVGATAIDAGASSVASPDANAPSEPADAGAPATRACVECRTGDDCGPEAPLCDANSCVQCLVDTDCADPNAPRCDTATNTCGGCDAVGQCSRFGDTPACNLNDGKCVECTASEGGACEDFACQTTPGFGQYTCSSQELADAGRCEPCVSDGACGTGMACILENFGDQDTEWVCLPERPGAGCTTLRQLGSTLYDATSADQVVGNYCKPPRTTCAAVRHYGTSGLEGSDWCDTDDDCGLPGVTDGFCLPYGSNEETRLCTYQCIAATECRTGVVCDTVDGSGETAICTLD